MLHSEKCAFVKNRQITPSGPQCRVRQSDDDDERIAPAAINLHLDGQRFDAIDGGRQDVGQHGRMVGQRGLVAP